VHEGGVGDSCLQLIGHFPAVIYGISQVTRNNERPLLLASSCENALRRRDGLRDAGKSVAGGKGCAVVRTEGREGGRS